MKLERLRFRWAAMNPRVSTRMEKPTQAASRSTRRSRIASRFSWQVGDWDDLGDEDRRAIADPRGDGVVSRDACGLRAFIADARAAFERALASPNPLVIGYCCHVASSLGDAGLRISPRRVRQLVRNVLAVDAVSRLPRERNLRLALEWSLPQRSGLTPPDAAVILAAHRRAWEAVCSVGEERWLHRFHSEQDLARKLTLLLETCPCPDTGTLAVSQFLVSESFERQAIVAFALYPALLAHAKPPVGDEGIQDPRADRRADARARHRGDVARPAAHAVLPAGGAKWTGVHPDFEPALGVLKALKGDRRTRAEQLFLHLLAHGHMTQAPHECEARVEPVHGRVQEVPWDRRPFNCRQFIQASLVRDRSASAPFRVRRVVALRPPGGMSHLAFARALLAKAGMRDLDDLRSLDALPRGRFICRDVKNAACQAPRGDPLLDAAILALCNAAFYSSERPVVWTEARLRRRVELISVEAFYGD